MQTSGENTTEYQRLSSAVARVPHSNWQRWGPYLSERQWGTVREDYSADSSAWKYFPHDHARSRAYRWGEDGLLGWTDRECRLCFGLALWNGADGILKERLYGLDGKEGNHGEDVKESYFYLDATPTGSYCKALYKYPHARFPYEDLLDENRRLDRTVPEYELADTGAFDDGHWDVQVEYAKAAPNDTLIRITVTNRGPLNTLHVLPQLWFRNTWSWGTQTEGNWPEPSIKMVRGAGSLRTDHASLEPFNLFAAPGPRGKAPRWLFTDNETNRAALFNADNPDPFCKDAFHRLIVHAEKGSVKRARSGTKAAAHYKLRIRRGGTETLELRLANDVEGPGEPFGEAFGRLFEERLKEADEFYDAKYPTGMNAADRLICRQADAGLIWTKQFYHYVVADWLDGDPAQPPADGKRKEGRNSEWRHLFSRDILTMPDAWEYPWFAAWDTAFHCVAFAKLDPFFARDQLTLFLREWYMHPNGQIPAYEWNFSDVNPPVHAWAVWRVYQMSGPPGKRDRNFLARAFQKLLLNFTWWVNRKDPGGRNVFGGGFLGLDNIGVFDRSKDLPGGGHLEQADGTAWMAFYCAGMLSIAFELASDDPVYADIASKFFEHYVAIAHAMNTAGGSGLWDEEDGFYYDRLVCDGETFVMKLRSMVGIVPLFTVDVLEDRTIDRLPNFRKRMNWFLKYQREKLAGLTYMEQDCPEGESGLRLLAVPTREKLERILAYLLDEDEFLSPFGVRSMSRVYEKQPYTFELNGTKHRVRYTPAESDTHLFGGNSNWRGPVWFPLNFLLIEALQRYHRFYGDTLRVECPTGSGQLMNLADVAQEIERRLVSLFQPDENGRRPCHGDDPRFAEDPAWKDLVLFYEYFDGNDGRGCGASHQTGWTALAGYMLEHIGGRGETPDLGAGMEK